MNIITVIPARGGSKRIGRKNLLPMAGLPLVAHSIRHAKASRHGAPVYVTTDDAEIAAVARRYGAEVIERPPEISDDKATSESALIHALDWRGAQGLPDPELMVFLQCTSPVRRPDDLDRAIDKLIAENADSLFSACPNSRLIWAVKNGKPFSLNYNFQTRQREQDMSIQYRENGSIYVFKPEILRQHNNRLGGRIAIYEMDYWSSFQVDTADDVALLEWVLHRPEFAPAVEWPERIELVVFDFDGVMTDNTVSVTEDGREAVRCHRGDGWGLGKLRGAGISMMVLSTENNPVVSARCAKLDLPCHQNVGDKGAFLATYLNEHRIDPALVAYVGNDDNDRDCLRLVGFPVLVGDAHPSVMHLGKLILDQRGGYGAVREFCDRLLQHVNLSSSKSS